jgi:hypothetical protein
MHSLYPVNIDCASRREVEERLSNPNGHTFDSVQKDIYMLVKQDSYRRFLKSELYQACLMQSMICDATTDASV